MHDTATGTKPLLRAEGLVKYYPILGGVFLKEIATVKAVDGVDISTTKGKPWVSSVNPGAESRPWVVPLSVWKNPRPALFISITKIFSNTPLRRSAICEKKCRSSFKTLSLR